MQMKTEGFKLKEKVNVKGSLVKRERNMQEEREANCHEERQKWNSMALVYKSLSYKI